MNRSLRGRTTLSRMTGFLYALNAEPVLTQSPTPPSRKIPFLDELEVERLETYHVPRLHSDVAPVTAMIGYFSASRTSPVDVYAYLVGDEPSLNAVSSKLEKIFSPSE